MPCVDTLVREHKLLNRREVPIKSGDLRLQACRDRYNLPPYPAHNALLDALATAELLIAHAKHRSAGQKLSLGELL
jgi:DNA polymerase-3 subunit epsilon